MNKFKLIAVAGMCAAMAGCGGDESSSAKTGNASKAASAAVVYAPKIAASADVAAVWTDNSSAVLKPIADAVVKCFETRMGNDVEECKKFLSESGLSSAKAEWLTASAGNIVIDKILSGEAIPDVALAVRFDHDLVKIIDSLKANSDISEEIDSYLEKTEIDGYTAYVYKGSDIEIPGVKPVIASLDGKVLVAAVNENVAKAQIALYRSGKDANAEFKGVAANNVLTVFVPNAGKVLSKAVSDEKLAPLDMVIPDGKRLFTSFKSLEYGIFAADKLSAAVTVKAGSADDASTLKTFIDSVMPMAKSALEADTTPDGALAREIVSTLSVTADGDTLKIGFNFPDGAVEAIANEILSSGNAF